MGQTILSYVLIEQRHRLYCNINRSDIKETFPPPFLFILFFIFHGGLKVCQVFWSCFLHFFCLIHIPFLYFLTGGRLGLEISARVRHNDVKHRRDVSQKNDTHQALPNLKICSLFTEKNSFVHDCYHCLRLCWALILSLKCQCLAWIAQWQHF